MMTETPAPAAKVRVHPFEKSGLGKAPFRFVCMISMPSNSLAGTNPSAYNAAMREAVYSARSFGVRCGACYYCGMGLLNNFVIRSADGMHAIVGCDCVERINFDPSLNRSIKNAVRELAAKRKAAKKVNAAKAAKIAAKAEARVARKAVVAAHRALLAEAYAYRRNTFLRDVIKTILQKGKISPAQINAMTNVIEREKFKDQRDIAEAARRKVAKHIGKIGERIEVDVLKIAGIRYDSAYGGGVISILRTPDGSTLKTFGRCPLVKGDSARIVCTVKAHEDYNGEPQTLVVRIKIKESAPQRADASSQ